MRLKFSSQWTDNLRFPHMTTTAPGDQRAVAPSLDGQIHIQTSISAILLLVNGLRGSRYVLAMVVVVLRPLSSSNP